jgi:hypothetical protein
MRRNRPPLAQNGAKEVRKTICFHGLICAGIRANRLRQRFKRSGRCFASLMQPSDSLYELEVSQADLAQTLKIVARAISKGTGDASFRFENGSLSVESANTVAEMAARGTWPFPIFAGVSWVLRLAKRVPAGEPIHLRVEAGRLYANRYSEPCAWTPGKQPAAAEPPPIDEDLLIAEAARILKPLRARRSQLEKLVSDAHARGTASWSAEEKRMIAIIAKAWVVLAPLDVETADLRQLVNNAVRNAWK